jgi:hypothetical protein
MSTEVQNHTKRSLAQSKVADIQARLDSEVLPAIRKVEEGLADIDGIESDWRATAAAPQNAENVAEDRKRLVNRLQLLNDVRKRAEAELRVEQAQVDVDALQELHAEFQKVGDARTQRVKDIIAAAHQIAALISEVELQREQLNSIAYRAKPFFVGRASGTEEIRRSDGYGEWLRHLRSTDVQAAVEHVLGMNTPSHVWEYGFRQSGGRIPDAVVNVSGQCSGGLLRFNEAMARLIEDAKE